MTSWTHLNDEALLHWRVKDLDLNWRDSPLNALIEETLAELKAQGLDFRPRIYLGDEWFSPSDISAVAIPFFLVHPRLRLLEKRMMLECEGESDADFKKLFRHELGHAFDHAFKISKRKSWRKTFGSPTEDYHPESYRPRPYSRNYVQNIPRWYAQSHPDEDFAETFAVWLNPQSKWREYYKDWGAYHKLLYVDKLCTELRGREKPEPKGRMISDARFLQTTLKRYYELKRKQAAEEYPDFYDGDLLKIFDRCTAENSRQASAYDFMRLIRKELLSTISLWTGERKVNISALILRLMRRTRELKLCLRYDEKQSATLIASFLTTLVTYYLFTGHFKRSI